MTVNASGVVGAVLNDIQPADNGKEFALGNTLHGTDGRKRVLVQASASIASAEPGTEVTITEPAFTAATGAGGFRAPDNVAVASGERFWARESAL